MFQNKSDASAFLKAYEKMREHDSHSMYNIWSQIIKKGINNKDYVLEGILLIQMLS